MNEYIAIIMKLVWQYVARMYVGIYNWIYVYNEANGKL